MDGYNNGRESQLKTVRKTIARHNARVGLGKEGFQANTLSSFGDWLVDFGPDYCMVSKSNILMP